MSRHLFGNPGRRNRSPRPSPARACRPAVECLEDRTVPATLPMGFTESVAAAGLSAATAMEFAPNGDLWVIEQGGAVKRFQAGSTTADVVGNVSTLGLNAEGERGLLGIAFHPDFAANKQVYLYYTSTNGALHNRVSSFTVIDSDAADYYFAGTSTAPADAGSTGTPTETLIFRLDNLSGATNHNGGAIHFDDDGFLFIAVGDNGNGANSQSLSTLHGKMLRLNDDGSIPTDNPFVAVTSGDEEAIWALGLRNPFTFTFQPGTGRLFINDVGGAAFEEINDGIAGSNYGWPNVEGNQGTPPAGPGTYRAPFYTYSHGGGTFQGFAITGGAFYNPATQTFPDDFAGDYFFADFVNSWINVIDVTSGAVSRFATGTSSTVDLRVTDDGSLYYLSRGLGAVVRVEYSFNWSGFSSLEGAGADIEAVTHGDGSQQVFIIGLDGAVWTRTRPPGGSFGPWSSLSGGAKALSVTTNAVGRADVFIIGLDNGIWTRTQAADGSWSAWSTLGGGAKALKADTNLDGSQQVFIIGLDNGIWARTEVAGSFGDWTNLGGGAKELETTTNAVGRVDVFIIGLDNGVWTRSQVAPGIFSGWTNLGGGGRALEVGTNADGTQQIAIIGLDNAVWTRIQAPGGVFSGWFTLGEQGNQVELALNRFGRLDVYLIGFDGGVRLREQGADGTFFASVNLGGAAKDLEVVTYADGSQQLFIVGFNNVISVGLNEVADD